jgi:tRNA(Ile)-lysidine synthase
LINKEFIEYFKSFGPFEDNLTIAVAVSGGADSLALTFLLKEYVAQNNGKLIALTVDHVLRDESKAEAVYVHELLSKHNIEHHILYWFHDKIVTSNIQQKAREARYNLLTKYCIENNIMHLVTAHHLNDQVENFLIRLERGSGVVGLSSMQSISNIKGVRLLRPLLSYKSEILKKYLNELNIKWIEDPSNDNEKYTRIKFRKFLATESEQYIKRINDTAIHMQRANNSINLHINNHLIKCINIDKYGSARLKLDYFNTIYSEEALRIITNIITIIGGKKYSPRFSSIIKLYNYITKDNLPTALTIGGCKVIHYKSKYKSNELLICREISKAGSAIKLNINSSLLWDQRFLITFRKNDIIMHLDNLKVDFLKEKGWSQLLKLQPDFKNIDVAKNILFSLPTIWQVDKIIAVPTINYYIDDKLKNYINCYFKPLKPLSSNLINI